MGATKEVQPAEFEAFRQKILVAQTLRILPGNASGWRPATREALRLCRSRLPFASRSLIRLDLACGFRSIEYETCWTNPWFDEMLYALTLGTVM